MPTNTYGRFLLVVTLAFVPAACSEQGLLPASPVAPNSADGAAKPGGGSTGFPVISTVADGNFHVESDNGSAYVPSRTLQSEVQPSGDWVLDSLNITRSARKLSLDFSSPVAGSVPGGGDPVPLPDGLYKFRALMQCSVAGNSLTGTWTLNQSALCPLRIAFDVGGDRYVLIMNSQFATTNGPFPTTDDVSVTCTAVNGSTCSAWQLTPSSPSGAHVAKLVRTDGAGGILEDRGDFNLSFSIGMARQ